MAPIGQATLPGVNSTLPDRDPRVGGKTVLEKVERTAGTHHAAQFGEGKAGVRDRAQSERGQGSFTAGVIEGDGLAVETDMLDPDGRRGDSTGGQPPGHLGRFDRKDDIDRGRVVRDIESGAEADLDNPTVQPVGCVGTPPRHLCGATGPVYQPRQDMFTIKPHVRTVARTRSRVLGQSRRSEGLHRAKGGDEDNQAILPGL